MKDWILENPRETIQLGIGSTRSRGRLDERDEQSEGLLGGARQMPDILCLTHVGSSFICKKSVDLT